jgi:hypothetical protein
VQDGDLLLRHATILICSGGDFYLGWTVAALKKTPVMAAGIAGHPWTMDELLAEIESE